MFAYWTKELRISKQSLYKLVYGRELTLVMDHKSYRGTIIEKLLKIIDKVLQLREMVRRTIQKAQAELNRKFKGKLQRNFQKGELV